MGKSSGGVQALTWHLYAEAGQCGVARCGGGRRRREVGDKADVQGPHGGDRREKRCYSRNA
jgi:hypothetical protein